MATPVTTVHWTSAFWGIVAVALNAMLQDSGSILWLSGKYRFALCSSPWFCLADSLLILYDVGHELRTHGIRDAIQKIADRRAEDAVKVSVSPFWSVITQVVVFVLAVAQVVKIFAVKGLPWTKAFAAMFMVEYLVQAALNLARRHSRTNYPATTPTLEERPAYLLLRRGAIALQVMLWALIFAYAAPESWFHTEPLPIQFYPAVLIFLVFFLMGIPIYAASVLVLWVPALTALLLDLVICLLPTLAIIWVIITFIALKTKAKPFKLAGEFLAMDEQVLKSIALFATTACGSIAQIHLWGFLHVTPTALKLGTTGVDLIFDNGVSTGFSFFRKLSGGLYLVALTVSAVQVIYISIFKIAFEGSLSHLHSHQGWKTTIKDSWPYVFFLLFNLGTTLLYYSHVYDPEGTYKPAWTDYLG